jgi:hypothetical protein
LAKAAHPLSCPVCARSKKCAAFGKPREARHTVFRHDGPMDEALLCALLARRPAIRRQWERLLRLEKPASALAHPDMLVRLIDSTLDEVFVDMRRKSRRATRRLAARRRPRSYDHVRAACGCGGNPLIEYFLAGERALIEALVLAQADSPPTGPMAHGTAATEVHVVVRHIAEREVTLFCSVCQIRETPDTASAREPVCVQR